MDARRKVFIEISKDPRRVTLSTDREDAESLTFPFPGNSESLKTGLRQQIEGIRQLLDRERLDFGTVESAMNEFRDLGTNLANQFFGGSDAVEAAQQFFRSLATNWKFGDGSDLEIAIHAPLDSMFPIELMPLFDYGEYWRIRDMESLADAARRMLGFGSIIHRVPTTHPTPQPLRRELDRIKVRLFRDSSLEGTGMEVAFLASEGRVVLDGPWPGETDDPADSDVSNLLAACLIEAAHNIDGSVDLSEPADIVQLSCHCDTAGDVPSEYSVGLKGDIGDRTWITLGDLTVNFTQHVTRMSAESRSLHRPIVMLNACGGASLDARTAASFPDLFLRERFPAFVGPEADVPDVIAATFSTLLYRQLLAGTPMGLAVLRTRWNLLARLRNPLGLLWVTYGDPDLAYASTVAS